MLDGLVDGRMRVSFTNDHSEGAVRIKGYLDSGSNGNVAPCTLGQSVATTDEQKDWMR